MQVDLRRACELEDPVGPRLLELLRDPLARAFLARHLGRAQLVHDPESDRFLCVLCGKQLVRGRPLERHCCDKASRGPPAARAPPPPPPPPPTTTAPPAACLPACRRLPACLQPPPQPPACSLQPAACLPGVHNCPSLPWPRSLGAWRRRRRPT